MSLATERGVPGTPGDPGAPLLSLRGIVKTFGPVQALRGVDLDIFPGQITALVGDNGAGKSTLIKTVSGIWSPTAGQISWEGHPVTVRTPRDADALGIATVYQDLALCDNLDIVQNMYLGHELLRHRLLDETRMEQTARKTLADLSVTTVSSVRQLVGSLSGGQRQSVAVARAVMRDAKLVIMDEPTAALGVSQTAQVLDLIRRLGARGIAVLVISHNLTDVFAVADRLAVLYLGQLVSSGPIAEYDTQRAVELVTTGALAHPERPVTPSTNGSADPSGPGSEP
ncbi:MAG: ATP-binding cassette domain-containing protein [Acidimicrobiales bacterium]|jgi:ABC-type sugar transport system ATPase subunit